MVLIHRIKTYPIHHHPITKTYQTLQTTSHQIPNSAEKVHHPITSVSVASMTNYPLIVKDNSGTNSLNKKNNKNLTIKHSLTNLISNRQSIINNKSKSKKLKTTTNNLSITKDNKNSNNNLYSNSSMPNKDNNSKESKGNKESNFNKNRQ